MRRAGCAPTGLGRVGRAVAASILLVAITGAAMTGPASAACRSGNPTVNDYVCSGTVVNAAGDGLQATSTSGNLTATVRSGSVTGATNGINASTTGSDSIGITANGNVTGTARAGIASTSNIGYSQIDIGAGAIVSGAAGVQVVTSGAYGILNNAGTIAGGNAPGITLTLGVGSESVNNNGLITATGGTAATVVGGAMATFNNNDFGIIDGKILGNVTTSVNNFGTWRNAGGSTIGTLVSSGTLALGVAGTSTLTVGGDATFTSGATTLLNITPGGGSDRINVVGDVTIGGGKLLLHGTGSGYSSGTRYLLLSSQGQVTGAFSSVTTDIPKFLPILALIGADLSVTLAQYDFRDYALTRNQLAAATMVTQAAAGPLTPAGTTVLLALDAMSPDQVRSGLTQLAGDGLTAAKSVALRQGSLFLETVAEQQAFWRSRESVDPNGITLSWSSLAPAPAGPRWYAGQPQPLRAPPPPPVVDRVLRMWVSGFGSTQTTNGNLADGSVAQSGRVTGGAVGVDAQVGRHVLLGAAGGYSVGAFSASERLTNGSNNTLHAALYSSVEANGFYGSASVGYAGTSTSTKRTVGLAGLPVEQETGSASSTEFRVRLEAGKLLDLGVGTVTPFTAVQGATLTTKPFAETSISSGGAGLLGLAFPTQTTHSVPVEIGLRGATHLRMGLATLAPWVQVSLVHDFSTARNNVAILTAFPGIAQTVYGPRDARDTLRLRGGAQLSFSPRAALFVSAEADLAKSQRVYAGKGGFRYGW